MPGTLSWRVVLLPAAVAYWMANAALHLEFSNWITSTWQTPVGPLVPVHYSREIAWLCASAFGGWLLWRGRGRPVAALTWLGWGVLAAAALTCNRWLLTTPVETIHYLQYGIIAVLFACALDPLRSRWPLVEIWLILLWLSVLDEAWQYLVLTPRQGSYFDMNDLLLNQLGVLMGLLARYGFGSPPRDAAGMPVLKRCLLGGTILALGAAAAAAAIGWLVLDPGRAIPPGGFHPDDAGFHLYLQREPGLYGNWQRTFSDGWYFVLSPWQGGVLLLATVLPCLAWRYSARPAAVQ